MYLHM